MMDVRPSISIVTATLNAGQVLPQLVQTLCAQTDPDFTWVVADGLSSDNTLALVRDSGLRHSVSSARDFGIYDALNRAVVSVQSDYYLVIGADDSLQCDAIEKYRAAVVSHRGPDFVAAAIHQQGRTIYPKSRFGWLSGMPGLASSHSVGLLIRHRLHDEHGLYSRRLPIAADQLFVKQAVNAGATVARMHFVAGEFAVTGSSGSDHVGQLTEMFRVQLATEKSAALQLLLFLARLMKLFLKGGLRPARRN